MIPKKIEFDIGVNRYGQPIKLRTDISHKGYWEIYKGAANQRDDETYIAGLSTQQIVDMADAVVAGGINTIPFFADLIYEDDLPKDISDSEYSQWFHTSHVVDGVRMGRRLDNRK